MIHFAPGSDLADFGLDEANQSRTAATAFAGSLPCCRMSCPAMSDRYFWYR
jgi:hypothetical protein